MLRMVRVEAIQPLKSTTRWRRRVLRRPKKRRRITMLVLRVHTRSFIPSRHSSHHRDFIYTLQPGLSASRTARLLAGAPDLCEPTTNSQGLPSSNASWMSWGTHLGSMALGTCGTHSKRFFSAESYLVIVLNDFLLGDEFYPLRAGSYATDMIN